MATSTMLPAAAAHADDAGKRDEAGQLFRAAMAAYDRHDYRAAALSFEEANHRVADASTLYNAARAWDDAGDFLRAADDYTAADANPLDPQSKMLAEKRLDQIEATVGTLTLTSSSEAVASVDRIQDRALPRVVHLNPGTYDISVQPADGRDAIHRSWTARAGLHETLKVVIPPAAAPKAIHTTPTPQPEPKRGHGLEIAGIGVLGLGAVAAGFAIGFGASTLSATNDYDASGHTDAAARSKAIDFRTVTNVFWVAAATSGAVGASLLTIGLVRGSSSSADVAVTTNGLRLRASF